MIIFCFQGLFLILNARVLFYGAFFYPQTAKETMPLAEIDRLVSKRNEIARAASYIRKKRLGVTQEHFFGGGKYKNNGQLPESAQ